MGSIQMRSTPAGPRLFIWEDSWDHEVSVPASREVVGLVVASKDGTFLGDAAEYSDTMRILFQAVPVGLRLTHPRDVAPPSNT